MEKIDSSIPIFTGKAGETKILTFSKLEELANSTFSTNNEFKLDISKFKFKIEITSSKSVSTITKIANLAKQLGITNYEIVFDSFSKETVSIQENSSTTIEIIPEIKKEILTQSLFLIKQTKTPDPQYPWKYNAKNSEAIFSSTSPQEFLEISSKGTHITGNKILQFAEDFRMSPHFESNLKNNPSILLTLHKLYDKAAEKFTSEGDITSAFMARSLAAEHIKFNETHPLHDMSHAIDKGKEQQPNPSFGAHFSHLGAGEIKRGHLKLDEGTLSIFNPETEEVERPEVIRFQFRINEFARRDLQRTVADIEKNKSLFEKMLPEPYKNSEVQITIIPSLFYAKNQNGNFDDELQALDMGFESIQIYVMGLGYIRFGASTGCLWQDVQVIVGKSEEKGEDLKKAQVLTSLIGLGSVLCQQRPEDEERLKIATLFHNFFPETSLKMERTKQFYEISLADLKAEMTAQEPEMQSILDKYSKENHLLQKEHIFPGKEVMTITDLSTQMKEKGAVGLMATFASSGKNIEKAARSLSRRLKDGSISSLDRFQSGIGNLGLASDQDIYSGGGEQFFSRLITKSNINVPVNNFLASGIMQICFSLDLLNRGAYAYTEDLFGGKNCQNEESYKDYRKRPNLIKFTQNMVEKGLVNSEVMSLNRCDPGYITCVVVNSEEDKEVVKKILREEGVLDRDENVCMTSCLNGKKEVIKVPFADFIKIPNQNAEFKGSFNLAMWANK